MTNKELAAGGVLILAACAAGYFAADIFDGTDDRPPIEVVEGSIDFAHGYPWADQSGAKNVWRPDHPTGKHVKQYDVAVTTNGADAGCGPLRGKTITIVYESRTFTIDTKPHSGGKKDEPELISPDPLDLDMSGYVLSLSGDGKIKSVTVGNSPACDVSAKPKIRISAKPKPR